MYIIGLLHAIALRTYRAESMHSTSKPKRWGGIDRCRAINVGVSNTLKRYEVDEDVVFQHSTHSFSQNNTLSRTWSYKA